MQRTALQPHTLALALGECHMEASPHHSAPAGELLKSSAKSDVCTSTFFLKRVQVFCSSSQRVHGPSTLD